MPSLFRNASWGGLSASIRLLFGMGNLFLAIKLVGATLYGYLIVMASMTAFYVALLNSIHVIVITNAVELRSHPDSVNELRKLFSAVWLVTFLGVFFLVLAVFFLGNPFLHAFVYSGGNTLVESNLSLLLVPVALIAVSQIVAAGHMAVIESLGRFDLAAKAQLLGTPIVFVLLLWLGFFSTYQLNIVAVGWLLLAGAVIDLIFIVYVRLALGFPSSFKPTVETFKWLPKLLGQGVSLQGAKLVNVFFDPLNKFLLNHYVGPVSVSTYEVAMKVIRGIQMIFGGAFRTFLQLAEKLKSDGGSDYIKAIRYGFVPAILMYALGCVLMVAISRYWVKGEMEDLSIFYLMLIPPGVGIIFAGPLYSALVGIRDLGFIFRMHLNLAILNLLASLTLIPLFGLYGAGVGLFITTAYNALAEYRRYIRMIGPIVGLADEIKRRSVVIIFSLALSALVVLADQFLMSTKGLLIVEGISVVILISMLTLEPLTLRVARHAIGKLSNRA